MSGPHRLVRGPAGAGGGPDAALELREALGDLRRAVHVAMYDDLRRRTAEDPTPTEEELDLGAYVEALEPQVRDAVRELRGKGYATHSSGFYGYDPAVQAIEGQFELSAAVVERLGAVGVEVERRLKTTSIRFRPPVADLPAMKQMWDRVARALPDRGRPAPATRDFGSDHFRRLHRQKRLATGFIRYWLDEMGTYVGMAGPRDAERRRTTLGSRPCRRSPS